MKNKIIKEELDDSIGDLEKDTVAEVIFYLTGDYKQVTLYPETEIFCLGDNHLKVCSNENCYIFDCSTILFLVI